MIGLISSEGQILRKIFTYVFNGPRTIKLAEIDFPGINSAKVPLFEHASYSWAGLHCKQHYWNISRRTASIKLNKVTLLDQD